VNDVRVLQPINTSDTGCDKRGNWAYFAITPARREPVVAESANHATRPADR
jgi:hypothetical protein